MFSDMKTTHTTQDLHPLYQSSESTCNNIARKSRSMDSISQSDDSKGSIDEAKWPELTLDEVCISLKVIGDLTAGNKVKIINNKYLAEEPSTLITPWTRYMEGQNRERNVSFIEHLYNETISNVWKIYDLISEGIDVGFNISILYKTVAKINVFLHRYEVMRSTYAHDSSTFARLGVIRDKFYNFLDDFFRKIMMRHFECA